MREMTRTDLVLLMGERGGQQLSIHLPILVGDDRVQNTTRLKNLLREADARLVAGGGGAAVELELLRRVGREVLASSKFSRLLAGGMALFVGRHGHQMFYFHEAVDELLRTGRRYHVRPLLPLLDGSARYFVLALSQHAVRLLRCRGRSVKVVPLPDVPQSVDEALGKLSPERRMQFRSTGAGGARGGHPGGVHGDGTADLSNKDRISRFFRDVDRGVARALKGESAPLVLAGVDYLLSLYREVNDYDNVLEQGIHGNPEELSDEQLAHFSREVVRPLVEGDQAEALERYLELAGGDRASGDLRRVLEAAQEGRVDTLFVARSGARWGSYDSKSRELRRTDDEEAGAEDLLDTIVGDTVLGSGIIYALEPEQIPSEDGVAAIFRY